MEQTTQEYLTKDVAAGLLNISERRVLEVRGIRQKDSYNEKTKRWQKILCAEDVQRVVEERAKGGEGYRMVRTKAEVLASESVLLAGKAAAAAAALPPTRRQWLTLQEACEFSGLPVFFLRALVGRGELPARDLSFGEGRARHWRINRADLEGLRGEIQTNTR